VLLSESRFDAQLRQLGLIENTTNSVSALNLRPTDLAVDLTQEEKAVSIAPLMLTVERALVGESKIELEPFSRLRGRDCRRCLAMAAQIWLRLQHETRCSRRLQSAPHGAGDILRVVLAAAGVARPMFKSKCGGGSLKLNSRPISLANTD